MSASESQVKSVRECTAAVRSLSAHLARVALGRAARTPMPMMGAAATRPGRRAVEPMSFAALSSTAMAPERRAGRCERVPARPGLRAMGAGFELSRLPRTFEKVVARPPPTEESNLNTPHIGGGAAPAVGMICKRADTCARQPNGSCKSEAGEPECGRLHDLLEGTCDKCEPSACSVNIFMAQLSANSSVSSASRCTCTSAELEVEVSSPAAC